MKAVFLVLLLLFCGEATAQDAPVLLEYPEGPVVNSNRVMALGGAYVGVAEGADGHLYNPASFAYRYPYTRNNLVDWDWTLYLLNVPGRRNPDLYGGDQETTSTSWFGGGLDIKIGGFGAGFHVNTMQYQLEVEDGTRNELVSNTSLGVGLAYSLHQLDVTLGSYVYLFSWTADLETGLHTEKYQLALRTYGAGSRIGLLWAPRNRPLRIGLVYRTPFNATGVKVYDAEAFDQKPDGISLPGQLSLGGSIMVWERTYNPNQTWGMKGLEDERPTEEQEHLRRYVMISYDIVAKGAPRPGTVSMRGFLRDPDRPIPIKEEPSFGFRGGIESEIIANWLVLRGGYYFEPARTALIAGRHHGTGGFAFRLPASDVIGFWPWDLRLEASTDIALNYFNYGVGIGFWH